MTGGPRRVSWRLIAERFTHIDATFVEAHCILGAPGSRYVVRIYPWWEHPSYRAALRDGKPWRFVDIDAVAKEVTVWPIELVAFRLSRCQEVVDWAFVEDHPVLWPYQDSGQIFCNEDFDPTAVLERVAARRSPYVTADDVAPLLGARRRRKAPFGLPPLPKTAFDLIKEVLDELQVDTFVPRVPAATPTPVALVLDGCDYLIASDFEIDLPEFEHPPEVFAP